MTYLNHEQVANAIAAVGGARTIVVEGENGSGKTSLWKTLAKRPEFAQHIFCTPVDCTQLNDGSVLMPDIDHDLGISRELPNERFGVSKKNQLGVNGSKPVAIAFDEIAKPAKFIKNMIAPIVFERRIGTTFLPEGSLVVAFTNLGIEGLGDQIEPHLRNRLIFIRMRKPNAVEWRNWGMDNNIHDMLLAYVEKYPNTLDSFLDYESGGKYEGKKLDAENPKIFNPRLQQLAYASPRSLHAVSDVLHRAMGKLDDETLNALIEGAIGAPAAAELGAFLRFDKDIVSFERIVKDPKKAPLSDNPIAQLIQVMQCVSRTGSREEAEAVTIYIGRMKEELQSVFCNSVSTSPRIPHFVTLNSFTKMLAAHRIYYGSK